MRHIARLVAASLLALAMGAAQAQRTHSIAVQLDASTQVDADLLSMAAKGSTPGAVPQMVRKLVAGLLGEMQLLVAGRIDPYGLLKLDDGSMAQLVDGDEIRVSAQQPTVRVVIARGSTDARPRSIYFIYSDGTCKVIDMRSLPPVFDGCSGPA